MRTLYALSRPSLYRSMTGISTVNSRRLPASLSSNPIVVGSRQQTHFIYCPLPTALCLLLIMARHRFNREDHFFVGHFLGGADEAGVASVQEEGAIAFSVASQRADQLPSFRVVERTEVHRRSPSREKKPRAPPGFRSDLHSIPRRQLRQQQVDTAVNAFIRAIRL